jgi:DNA polymerase elongation subunit (family B)
MGETEQARLADVGEGVAAAEAVAGDGGHSAPVVDLDEERFPPVEEELAIAVTQVDYTIAGNGQNERPIVHVFGRRPDAPLTAPSVHVRVHDFEPYFYTPTETLEERKLDKDVITHAEEGYTGIRGEALTKVCARTPRDVGQIRDEFDHFEADILFPNRLLIDKDIQSGIRVPDRRAGAGSETDGSEGIASDGGGSIANEDAGDPEDERIAIDVHHEEITATDAEASPRVLTFDIEVDDRSGFPEEGEETILCLTSHESGREEYVTWLYEAPEGNGASPEGLDEYEPIDGNEIDVSVEAFDSEEAMLEAFIEYVRATDPDIMTGWNFADFDAPYLLDRLEVLGGAEAEGPNGDDVDLDPDRLSRIEEVWRSNWQGPNIKGRVVFDLLYAYQRTQFSELDSYRLDAVGEVELGVGKERYPGSIGDLWESDPEQLLEYNLRDVELCVEIDRGQDVITFWREVAAFVGCKLEDAPTPGDVVDMYVLHEVHSEFVLPSKGRQEAEDYEGGAVFDPITGVRENVAVLDLASLYPMSMVTVNASPETKVDPERYDGETYRAPNGTHFRKKPDGIIREMVDDLLEERERFKELRNEQDHDTSRYVRYDRQQSAIKRVMNSLYGVAGWDRFRLYDKEFGAAVTATGRSVLEFTEEAANEFGYQVAYGDTDSVMLELGQEVTTDEAVTQAQEIGSHINGSYDDFAGEELGASEHRFEIEFEKLYRRFFQAGRKKRYAGHVVWKEGREIDDIDITGFEYKRSDIAPITKRVQREVIERVVYGEDLETVSDYVRGEIERFQESSVDLEEVGIPGGIGKRLNDYDTDTAQVRGAKYANLLLGTNFKRGSKPKRLYLERVHPDFFERIEHERADAIADNRALYEEFKRERDVICFEYDDQIPDEFTIDSAKMLEKTLQGPIARVLDALDVSWQEVKSGQTQTGLGSFV